MPCCLDEVAVCPLDVVCSHISLLYDNFGDSDLKVFEYPPVIFNRLDKCTNLAAQKVGVSIGDLALEHEPIE